MRELNGTRKDTDINANPTKLRRDNTVGARRPCRRGEPIYGTDYVDPREQERRSRTSTSSAIRTQQYDDINCAP